MWYHQHYHIPDQNPSTIIRCGGRNPYKTLREHNFETFLPRLTYTYILSATPKWTCILGHVFTTLCGIFRNKWLIITTVPLYTTYDQITHSMIFLLAIYFVGSFVLNNITITRHFSLQKHNHFGWPYSESYHMWPLSLAVTSGSRSACSISNQWAPLMSAHICLVPDSSTLCGVWPGQLLFINFNYEYWLFYRFFIILSNVNEPWYRNLNDMNGEILIQIKWTYTCKSLI